MRIFFAAVVFLFCTNARADDFDNKINELKVLSLHNGENFLKLSNHDTIIFEAEFNGDSYNDIHYFVYQKKNKVWEAAHFGKLETESVIGSVDDESYKDKLYGIKRIFLVPKSNNKNYSELYLLEYRKDNSGKVQRILYELNRDPDFDILSFREIFAE